MIIQSSEVSMASRRTYSSTQRMEQSISVTPVIVLGGVGVTRSDEGGDFMSSMNYYMDKNGSVKEVGETSPSVNEGANLRIQFHTMSYLLRLLLGEKLSGGCMGINEAFDQLFGSSGKVLQTTSVSYDYAESETTSFSSEGKVITADGREISFNYSLEMSRSFKESYSEIRKEIVEGNFCDPLVINLDSNPTEVSEQHFYFDLNMDGTEEEICMLGPGSGYLALDLDGDGKITNGGELFGAKTGDGFFELAAYDEDGNGWIDEADSIFSKLRIWSIDKDGKNQLFTLKQSDVGAIFLGKASGDFSITDKENNAKAKVRATGIYLKESDGSAGTIQHVDMAT